VDNLIPPYRIESTDKACWEGGRKPPRDGDGMTNASEDSRRQTSVVLTVVGRRRRQSSPVVPSCGRKSNVPRTDATSKARLHVPELATSTHTHVPVATTDCTPWAALLINRQVNVGDAAPLLSHHATCKEQES
jgi:hypothetical protein